MRTVVLQVEALVLHEQSTVRRMHIVLKIK